MRSQIHDLVRTRKMVKGQTAGSLIVCLSLLGCGSHLPISDFESTGSAPYQKRFTDEDIAAVYSEETNPQSPKTITRHFDQTSQAPDLAEEFGNFNVATEVKGYLFLNQDPTFLAPARYIVAMEAVSGWTKIVNRDGTPLFTDAYTTDQPGNRIPDEIDGELDGESQTHYGRVKMPVGIAKLSADMRIQIAHRGDLLTAFLDNERDIRAPFVGTVVAKREFRIALELYPYRKGYLAYAVNASVVRQFSDRLPPDVLSGQVDAILSWLHGKLLGQSQDFSAQ